MRSNRPAAAFLVISLVAALTLAVAGVAVGQDQGGGVAGSGETPRASPAPPTTPASPSPADAVPPASSKGDRMEKFSGVWIEGPGYDIKYGGNYEGCARRCLDSAKCVMVEFYWPEKKCNHYDTVRPRLKGGSSHVGVRKPAAE